jgi:hypothetical protein
MKVQMSYFSYWRRIWVCMIMKNPQLSSPFGIIPRPSQIFRQPLNKWYIHWYILIRKSNGESSELCSYMTRQLDAKRNALIYLIVWERFKHMQDIELRLLCTGQARGRHGKWYLEWWCREDWKQRDEKEMSANAAHLGTYWNAQIGAKTYRGWHLRQHLEVFNESHVERSTGRMLMPCQELVSMACEASSHICDRDEAGTSSENDSLIPRAKEIQWYRICWTVCLKSSECL